MHRNVKLLLDLLVLGNLAVLPLLITVAYKRRNLRVVARLENWIREILPAIGDEAEGDGHHADYIRAALCYLYLLITILTFELFLYIISSSFNWMPQYFQVLPEDQLAYFWRFALPVILGAILVSIFIVSFLFTPRLQEKVIVLSFVSFFLGVSLMAVTYLEPRWLPDVSVGVGMDKEKRDALLVLLGLLLAVVGPVGGLVANLEARFRNYTKSVGDIALQAENAAYFLRDLGKQEQIAVRGLAIDLADTMSSVKREYLVKKHGNIILRYLEHYLDDFIVDLKTMRNDGRITQRHIEHSADIYDHMINSATAILRMTSYVSFKGINFWDLRDESGTYLAHQYLQKQQNKLLELRKTLIGAKFERLVILRNDEIVPSVFQSLQRLQKMHIEHAPDIDLRFGFESDLLVGRWSESKIIDMGIVDQDLLLENRLDPNGSNVIGYVVDLNKTNVSLRLTQFDEFWQISIGNTLEAIHARFQPVENWYDELRRTANWSAGRYDHVDPHWQLDNAIIGEVVNEIGGVDLTALDAGCGEGDHLLLLLSRAKLKNIIGLDFSHKMISLAESRVRRQDTEDRCKLVHDDLFDSPFDDNAFDLILCMNNTFGLLIKETLNSASSARNRGMRELARLLKPDGKIIMTVLDFSQWTDNQYGTAWAILDDFSIPGNGDFVLLKRGQGAYECRFFTHWFLRSEIVELAEACLLKVHSHRQEGYRHIFVLQKSADKPQTT